MDLENIKRFINAGIYDNSKERVYTWMFAALAAALLVIFLFVLFEMPICSIVLAALLVCYMVVIFRLNKKITGQNAFTFLSYGISAFMLTIVFNFVIQTVLYELGGIGVTGILVSLAIQTAVFVFLIIIIHVAVKRDRYKIYESSGVIITVVVFIMLIVLGALSRINQDVPEMESLVSAVLGGMLLFMLPMIMFVNMLAHALLKWHYCRKYNITVSIQEKQT